MAITGRDTGDFIRVGKIAKPHGVRGELKIYPYSGQPENFSAYRNIYIDGDGLEEYLPTTIEKCRVQGKFALLTLSVCRSRDDAERLTGREVWLQRDQLPELDEAEYYWLDLEGKKVVTKDGQELGKISAIYETGAHDIINVAGNSGEYLIPLHDDFIVSIDEEKVVMNLPPGLLEMNK